MEPVEHEAREREGPPWFEVSMRVRLGILAVSALGLGWVLFHVAPSALDDLLVPRHPRPSEAALGPTPYFAAILGHTWLCVTISCNATTSVSPIADALAVLLIIHHSGASRDGCRR